jgi:hypothetical protein
VPSTIRADELGFEPGQDAQGLRVALEAPALLREVIERLLPVVAERRMADVVG